jgi:serine/threonine-protein kinase
LGDPTAGAKSLSGLVSQTPASTEDDLEDWEGERLPLGISYPWIPSTFTRVVSAVAALVAAWPIAEALFSHNLVLARAAALACVAITALWPPLGSALVFGGLATTIAVHSATASPLLLAIVMGSLAVAWWVRCAMESNLSTLAALMPACLSSPLAGTAIAGYALRLLPALLTACLSWIVGRIWPTLLATRFGLDGLVDALLMPLAAPPALMSMAGCAFSAVLCSAMTWRNDAVGTAIAGQALGCITLVGFQLLAARMENGGIWADPSWDNTGIAVLLSVLVCIACVLQGPRDVDVESED